MASATTEGRTTTRGTTEAVRAPERTRSTETKSALKTTELMVYIASVIAVLVASAIIDENDAGGFGARQAWLYVTILTVGYMLSRGFAKSGSRDPYTEGR